MTGKTKFVDMGARTFTEVMEQHALTEPGDLMSVAMGFALAASSYAPPPPFKRVTALPHRHEATSAAFIRDLIGRLSLAADELEDIAAQKPHRADVFLIDPNQPSIFSGSHLRVTDVIAQTSPTYPITAMPPLRMTMAAGQPVDFDPDAGKGQT